jgi:hypothetical protein
LFHILKNRVLTTQKDDLKMSSEKRIGIGTTQPEVVSDAGTSTPTMIIEGQKPGLKMRLGNGTVVSSLMTDHDDKLVIGNRAGGIVFYAGNMEINGEIETNKIKISGIAEWVGTVYTIDNIWNVNTIKSSRITPSSITNYGTGAFRISFTGATLPMKGVETGSVMSEGSRRYYISGSSAQGTTLTNSSAAWFENSIQYNIRAISDIGGRNSFQRIRVTVLLDE